MGVLSIGLVYFGIVGTIVLIEGGINGGELIEEIVPIGRIEGEFIGKFGCELVEFEIIGCELFDEIAECELIGYELFDEFIGTIGIN
jgi:hypothetical protein